jgi:hypothetical protein
VTKRLFDEVVARCGLAGFLAQDVVRRACDAVGLSPEGLTREQLPSLAPSLRKSLSLFIKPRELDFVMRAIDGLFAKREGA